MSDYRNRFIEACRELGIGDLTIGHRKITDISLSEEHWMMIHLAYLAFQHQLKLITADAIARYEPKQTILDPDEVRILWESGEGMMRNPIKSESQPYPGKEKI